MLYVFGLAFRLSLIFKCLRQPLLVTGNYFDITCYIQRAACLLAYQEDYDKKSVLIRFWQIVGRGRATGVATH